MTPPLSLLVPVFYRSLFCAHFTLIRKTGTSGDGGDTKRLPEPEAPVIQDKDARRLLV